jgi:hypothetical protein
MANNALDLVDAEIGALKRQQEEAVRRAAEANTLVRTIECQIEVLNKLRRKLSFSNGEPTEETDQRAGQLTLAEHFDPIGPTRAIMAYLTSKPNSLRSDLLDAICAMPNLTVNSDKPRRVIDSCLRQLEKRGRVVNDERGRLSLSKGE